MVNLKKIVIRTLITSPLYFLLHTTIYAQDGVYDGVAGLDWIVVLVLNVLSIALRLVGVAALVMLAVGSIKMSTSGGDPEAFESGKKTFTMAIGGLVIAALAWFIFDVIYQITGVEGILNFSIPNLN